MTRALQRAGFDGAHELVLAADTPAEVAWETAAGVCNVSERDLAVAVADLFRLGTVDPEAAEPTAVKLIPESVARRFGVFPIQDQDRYLVVAVSDPTDPTMEQEVGFASGRTPSFRIAPPGAISKAIEAAYPPEQGAASLLSQVPLDVGEGVELRETDTVEQVTEEEVESEPVVRLTKAVFQKAIEEGASDIHIQPAASNGVVRFRIDGVLRTGLHMPLPVMTRVISRIKIMGNLDITDRLIRGRVRSRSWSILSSAIFPVLVGGKERRKPLVVVLPKELPEIVRDGTVRNGDLVKELL